jgi:predicted O-linked N-acetylglucosamine transferase (SPINDLY family)
MVQVTGAGPAAEVEQHRRAVRANPKNAQAHALLGLALQKLGRLEEAVASQRRALQLAPYIKGMHGVMATALHELGRYDEAADAYRHALVGEKDDVELNLGLSETLRKLGQLDEALEGARQAAELLPGNPATHLHLASILFAQEDFKGAAEACRRAVALQSDRVDARAELGRSLLHAGEYAAAAKCYRELIELAPTHLGAHLGLAACLRELEDFKESVRVLEQARAFAPDHFAPAYDLGLSHQRCGNLAKAHEMFLCAEQLRPGDPQALQALTRVCFDRGLWQDAVRYAREAMRLKIESPAMHSTLLFILSHCCADAADLTRETPLIAQRLPHTNDRDPERVLKVGFVSGDLYHHAVSTFVEPVFERLKHSTELELYVYSNNVFEDDVTRKLKGHIRHWHSIAALDDEAAGELIRGHGMDILIDLSGHSAKNRLPLFARKPAPVQMTWIGYAGTTGLKAMDYYISDRFHLPPGRYDDQFTEKIARLPLGTPWLPMENAPPVNALPASKNGYLTFGSFHRANKLSRELIGTWAHLLRAVPNARMLVGGLSQGSDSTLLDWFDQEGIDRDRLLLRYRAPMGEYLRQHYEVDVALASFPYTGATTACHALWMGVPTLTITGETNPTYSTASYLAHLGLSSFIADDAASFVALGQFLSQNVPTLAVLRQTMRERFSKSLVGYPGVSAAGLERAMRLMWRRWCDGLPPEDLQVRLSDLAAEPGQEAVQ